MNWISWLVVVLLIVLTLWAVYTLVRPELRAWLRRFRLLLLVLLLPALTACGTLSKLYKPPEIKVTNEIVCSPPQVDKIDLPPVTWVTVTGVPVGRAGLEPTSNWIALSATDYEQFHSNLALIWQQSEQLWAVILYYRDCVVKANEAHRATEAQASKAERAASGPEVPEPKDKTGDK